MIFLKDIREKLAWGKLGVASLVVSAIITLALASCTDDLGIRVDNPEDGENFTGITLYVPNVDGAAEFGYTRGDEYTQTRAYDTGREGNFNTLYIAAVKEGDGKVTTVLKTSSNGKDDEEYLKYRVNLPAGNYKFYVVANMNRYIPDGTFADVATNEEAIRKLVLNFSADRPLEPGFLPMACMAEDIKLGTSASSSTKVEGEGYIEIPTGESKNIYADLKYLCAKVRYTILFDRENSDYNGTSDIVNFNRNTASDYPYASYLRAETAIHTGNDGGTASEEFIKVSSSDGESNIAKWPIYLDRFVLPEATKLTTLDGSPTTDEGKKDIREILDGLTAWDSSKDNWNTDYLDQRAWQGVTYLPENLLQGDGKYTKLNFPYTVNSQTGASSPRQLDLFSTAHFKEEAGTLERSQMYDLIVKVKSADAEQWTVNVVPTDWTPQELVYQLHGPYELIVESSTVQTLSMQQPVVFWFRSDVPPQEIGFKSPYVQVDDEGTYKDLFIGKVVKNPDGTYKTNENGDYLFQVEFNLEIPYSILNKLNASDGYDYDFGDGQINYTKKDISFFHIVAGSLYKRIEILDLDLNPYLIVNPQTIIIDTRELFTSGIDSKTDTIKFETNVDLGDANVSLTLEDLNKLISQGKGTNALRISIPKGTDVKNSSNLTATGTEGTMYKADYKEGYMLLNIKDIIEGNTYWDNNNEYKLTFTLRVPVGATEEIKEITQVVTIKVRPFSGNYTIHFRDNTKPWVQPHIYIYQDLTLPADLTAKDPDDPDYNANELHKHAGKIVGWIEKNPNGALGWNAATQYVFSNNLSFKGWKGYGGPDINNPWEEYTYNDFDPRDNDNSNKSTMGFVMFGDFENGFWNYSYAYNFTDGITENPKRHDRYYYDVNFNSDHQKALNRWSCWDCYNMSPDNNRDNDQYFYPGIAMEREENGWWKYTLTGVAQPGRTLIIFSNYHAPWEQEERSYRAEDHRCPGDYEAGIPLFDFEDNDGWFLFDGNTTNADQKFTDDEPIDKIISHTFTSAYENLRLEIYNPSNKTISDVEIGHQNKYDPSKTGPYEDGNYDKTYHKDFTMSNRDGNKIEIKTENNKQYLELSLPSAAIGFEDLVITLDFGNNNTKKYSVSPKFFKREGIRYVSAKPLYLEFNNDIELFVKWSDNITVNSGWSGTYSYYQPPEGGSNWLSLLWGVDSQNQRMKTQACNDKTYGGYKYAKITLDTPPTGVTKDMISLRLCTTNSGESNYHQYLKAEDLPQYYIPSEGYYLINWHLFGKPYDAQ